MADLERLSLTELIQLQTQIGETLKRRFERNLCLCFSDIVASTQYFTRFGDAAGRGLQQRHLDVLAQALAPHEGRVVDTAGDGAFTVFSTADKAAQAVIDLENLISLQNNGYAREHQLQVRIGLHYGPVLTDGVAVTGEEISLPLQDTITFGRLKERNGFVANDVVLQLGDAALTKSISRWHFELRRNATGFLLRSVTDQVTEIDGEPLDKGAERAIKPGTFVRVANVLTLEFLIDEKAQRVSDSTYYPP